MHSQLTDKNLACKDLIEALESCHKSAWSRYFGGCNAIKHDLNLCLRSERVERTKRNGEQAKLRNEKRNKALEVLHKDD